LHHLVAHECASRVALKIHLTRFETEVTASGSILRSPSQTSTEVASIPAFIPEKNGESPALSTQTSSIALGEKDLERVGTIERVECINEMPSALEALNLPITYGRPNIEALVRQAIMSVDNDKRVLIAACGPAGLVHTVRNITADCIRVDGPSIELHCEQFGW
jgi:hypothetical protein